MRASFFDRIITASLYTQFHTSSEIESKAPKGWETTLAAILDPIFSALSSTYRNRKSLLSNRFMMIEEAKQKFSQVTETADRVLGSKEQEKPQVESLSAREPDKLQIEPLSTSSPQVDEYSEQLKLLQEDPFSSIRKMFFSFEEIENFLKQHGKEIKALNLSELGLNDNQFERLMKYCPVLEHLEFMAFLAFNASPFDGHALACLQGKPLRSLKLGFQKNLTDDKIALLKGLPLEDVCFNGCEQLTDKTLEHLNEMPLTSVSFYACDKLTDHGLKNLKGKPLKSVNFDLCTQLTDRGLVNFKGMALEEIGFSATQVTDEGVKVFKGMPLEEISLFGANVSEAAIDALRKSARAVPENLSQEKEVVIDFSHLEPLNEEEPLQTDYSSQLRWLKENPNVSLEDIFDSLDEVEDFLKRHGKELTFLNLDYLDIDDKLFEQFMKCCPAVRHLSFKQYSGSSFKGEGLACLKGMSIRTLDLSGQKKLAEDKLALLKELPLESIRFKNCTQLTDKALEFLKGTPIKDIDFFGCDQLTDDGLVNLRGMPLEKVSFGRCFKLTDRALENFKGMSLKEIDFGLTQVTDAGVKVFEGMPLENISLWGGLVSEEAIENLYKLAKKRDFKEDVSVSPSVKIPIKGVGFKANLITDAGFEHLKKTSLQPLNFATSKEFTRMALSHLKEMPLTSLYLQSDSIKELMKHEFDLLSGERWKTKIEAIAAPIFEHQFFIPLEPELRPNEEEWREI